MVIVPAVGSMSRLIIRRVVVLPHPDGPISTTIEPPATAEVERLDGRPSLPANVLVTPVRTMALPSLMAARRTRRAARSTGSSAADPPRSTRFPDVRRERPKRGAHIWVLIR